MMETLTFRRAWLLMFGGSFLMWTACSSGAAGTGKCGVGGRDTGGRGGSNAVGGRAGVGGAAAASAAATGGTGASTGAGGEGGAIGSGGAVGNAGKGGGAGGSAEASGGHTGVAGSGGSPQELARCQRGVCGVTLAIEPRHMVYDASRERLHVTIAGGATQYPNTITSVDPKFATVTSSIPVGSDPNVLVLSDDSSTVWVGMDGSFSMRKVSLTGTTPVVGPLFRIPSKSTRSPFVAVQSMVALSDSPLTVAALATNSLDSLAIYDDGVRRANPNATNVTPSSIFKGPPGMFFGTGSTGGQPALFWMRVLPTGIAQATFPDALAGAGSSQLLYFAGRIYAGTKVLDVSNPAMPTKVGMLPFSGTMTPHTSPSRLIMLSPSPVEQFLTEWELRLIDTDTFTQRGSVKIPTTLLGGGIVSENIFDVAYLGGDGLALLAASSLNEPRLVILHAPMLANDGVDPTTGAGGQGGVVGTGGAPGTGGASGTGGAGPGGLCAGCTLHQLDVPGFRMVYDGPRSRLYAILRYDAPHDKNTLVSVDVAKESVLATVPTDLYARQLALADDGATLWMGFDESSDIRKFSVASTPPVAVASYTLPALGTTASRPYDLVALPGTANSLAACIGSGGSSRIVILDDGVARPTIDSSRESISKLAVGPAGTLFGYDGMTSAYTFSSYGIDASGVTALSAQEGLIGGFQNDVVYYQGRIYANWGEVIDVANPAKPMRVGRFTIKGSGGIGTGFGLITPRSTTRMLMLTDGPVDGSMQLRILNTDTFTTVASLSLGPNVVSGGVLSSGELVYLGGDGIAFLNVGKSLVIFRSPMIATPP